MENTSQQNAKNRKFKQTKQLVRLALNDGWTQKSIADKCRAQQSIVSAWNSGEKQGTEAQLAPLLEQYGNQLRRKSFQVYYHFDSEEQKFNFFRVEGKVIFSYTFFSEQKNYKSIKKIPVFKIIVHEQGKGVFRTVEQNRPSSTSNEQGELVFRIVQQQRPHFNNSVDNLLTSPVESGHWFSYISEQLNTEQVIQKIETLSVELSKNKWLSEKYTLPFLIRKAMVENGYYLEDVVDYPSM
jgi:transcriptional regulator with XRE-family HTH domain